MRDNRKRGKECGMAPKDPLAGFRDAITKAGNQTKLAKKAGCAQQTLSDILKGRRPLTVTIALKVSKATGIPAHQIHPDLRGVA